MTNPGSVDPQLIAALRAEVAGLDNQLRATVAGLARLHTTVEQLASGAPPAPIHTAPAQPAAGQARGPVWQPQPHHLPYPAPGGSSPAWPPQPAPQPVAQSAAYKRQQSPHEPHVPWWRHEDVVSRLLAVTGVGVTLVGVVLLLVLAAQAGWFGPLARVLAGAALCISLLAVAFRVRNRDGGETGSIALAATAIAGLYLDTIAVTTHYHWVPAPVGLAIAGVIAAGGLTLASLWRSQLLAQLSITAVALLAPALTESPTPTLVAFLILLQAGCFAIQIKHDWPILHVTRTVPAVLACLAAIVAANEHAANRPLITVAAVAVALVGTATALAVGRIRPTDTTGLLMLGVAALPVLSVSSLYDRTGIFVIEGCVAVVGLALALVPALPVSLRLAAAVTAAVALLEVCFAVPGDNSPALSALAIGCAFIAAADPSRRAALWIGAAFTAIGGFGLLIEANPDVLTSRYSAADNLSPIVIALAVMFIATAVLFIWQADRHDLVDPPLLQVFSIAAAVSALYAFTAATVTAGVHLFGSNGFTIGHSAATVGWMIAATAILLRGGKAAGRMAKLSLGAGLVLAGAAVAKLFLYDLGELNGVARVAAFLAVGLLLLGVGTVYTKQFGDDQPASAKSDSPPPSAPQP